MDSGSSAQEAQEADFTVSEELRGQVEAIFEATFGGGECHDGGGIWLERQSSLDGTVKEGYIEILQDIDGATLEEAHAILQEISHVRREKNWETVRLF
ncbi:unnamed protein product [Durusdinium trenchii]|uniref:Uncharacterized protein n=1 Tax=Durusdinium trenchii TaxID=1381693 RepID=A0ABP0HQF4_9DINO